MADLELDRVELLSTKLIKRYGLSYRNFFVFPVDFVLKKNLALDVLTAATYGELLPSDTLTFSDAVIVLLPDVLSQDVSDDVNTWFDGVLADNPEWLSLDVTGEDLSTWLDDIIEDHYIAEILADSTLNLWSDTTARQTFSELAIAENVDNWDDVATTMVGPLEFVFTDDLSLTNLDLFEKVNNIELVKTASDSITLSDGFLLLNDLDTSETIDNMIETFSIQNDLYLKLEDTDQAEWKSNLLLMRY